MKEFVTLKNGLKMPRLGMGMWYIGEESSKARSEYEAIRMGIDSGVKLIDTAEMYGMGRSESFVGRAIKNYDRSSLFLVSKVLPSNAGRNHIRYSLEHSLKRLETDYLDMYLYHWIGDTPFPEVVESMERFVAFDVETPNYRNDRMSAIGISVIEDGVPDMLILPENLQARETASGSPRVHQQAEKRGAVDRTKILCLFLFLLPSKQGAEKAERGG